MASSKGARVFGLLILVACVAVIAGGGWDFFGRQLLEGDDTASDDEPDEIEPGVDGGVHHTRRPGSAGRKGGRGGEQGGGASRAVAAAAGAGPFGQELRGGDRRQPGAALDGGRQRRVGISTDVQLAGPMRNGTFLGACGTPDSTHVTVKVAIRAGRAVGVSVYPTPPNPQIAGCIERSVRNLAWPVNMKMDSFVTTY